MKERQNNCGLFSCLQEEEEVTALVAVVEEVVGEPSRGSRVTLYHHEVHTNQDKTTHLPSKGGGGLLGWGVIVVSVTMATQNSVSFSLPLL